MVVDASKFDRHTVKLEHTIISRDLAKPDAVVKPLHNFVRDGQVQFETVKPRRFSGPQFRSGNWQADRASAIGGQTHRGLLHLSSARIEYSDIHGPRLAGHQIELELRRAVRLQRRARRVIAKMGRRQGEDRNVAVDSRQAPAVHRVEVPALAARRHAHREHVRCAARQQRFRDVERHGIEAARPFADLPAVDPRRETVEHAVKAEKHPLIRPIFRHRKRAPIQSGAGSDFRAVLRLGESLQFPVARNGDLLPRTDLELWLKKRLVRARLNRGDIFEFP